MKQLHFDKAYLDVLDSLLDYSENSREEFLSLLHLIETSMEHSEGHSVGFFESHKIRNLFGRRKYKNNDKLRYVLDHMVDHLIERDVIIATDYSYKNGKTREYFYSSAFNLLLENRKLELELSNVQDAYYQSIITGDPPIGSIALSYYHYLKSSNFDIDESLALEWIFNEYKTQRITSNQYRCYIRMVLDLKDKRIYCTQSEKTGRISYNFNIIKRELRQFCRINGKKLISVDLKSSQPYFLASYFYQKWPNESQKFYDDVTKKDIYNLFYDLAVVDGLTQYHRFNGKYMEKVYIKDREDSKREMLRMLFKMSGHRPVYDIILENHYPEFYSKFRMFNGILWEDLQRIEASIFIPITDRWMERGCLSVHDSLYFVEDIKKDVINDLNKAFEAKGFKNYTLT
jgi:hypothetical protein